MNNSPGEMPFLQARSSTNLTQPVPTGKQGVRAQTRGVAGTVDPSHTETGSYQRRRAPAIAPKAGATTSHRPMVASRAVP
jgi:hypothetical protein